MKSVFIILTVVQIVALNACKTRQSSNHTLSTSQVSNETAQWQCTPKIELAETISGIGYVEPFVLEFDSSSETTSHIAIWLKDDLGFSIGLAYKYDEGFQSIALKLEYNSRLSPGNFPSQYKKSDGWVIAKLGEAFSAKLGNRGDVKEVSLSCEPIYADQVSIILVENQFKAVNRIQKWSSRVRTPWSAYELKTSIWILRQLIEKLDSTQRDNATLRKNKLNAELSQDPKTLISPFEIYVYFNGTEVDIQLANKLKSLEAKIKKRSSNEISSEEVDEYAKAMKIEGEKIDDAQLQSLFFKEMDKIMSGN